MFVGLDWANERHAVSVLNEQGEIVWQRMVDHTTAGLEQLLQDLQELAPPDQLAIAIERPEGLVVDVLTDADFPIVPIHPNILKASRPRYKAALGKSDLGDSYMLADLLRTDGHRFHVLRPQSDELRALRAQVRVREDLVRARVASCNQLKALLDSFWPGAGQLFSRLHSDIALAFLSKYPTPSSAERLGVKRMENFLRRQGYPGRRSPEELLARLRSAASGRVGPVEESAKGDLVSRHVERLKLLVQDLKKVSQQIEQAVAERPSGKILMSFPRGGQVNAAQILVELGEDPHRYPTHDALAAEAGVAPVTYASGNYRRVSCRHACNKRLRKAFTGFADNSRHASPWAKKVYTDARERGCSHAHAVRILARSWCRVVWKAWTDGKPYDPTRHGALQRLA